MKTAEKFHSGKHSYYSKRTFTCGKSGTEPEGAKDTGDFGPRLASPLI